MAPKTSFRDLKVNEFDVDASDKAGAFEYR